MDMSKMIQLRHVPDALHRQLKARAALSGLPLSDYLIREVRKIADGAAIICSVMGMRVAIGRDLGEHVRVERIAA